LLNKIIKSIRNKLSGSVEDQEQEVVVLAPPPVEEVEAQPVQRTPKSQPARQSKKPKPASPKSSPVPDKEEPKVAPKPKWSLAQFKVEPSEGKTRFHDLDLPSEIMHAIFDLGFEYCTPIQAGILPQTLSGVDASGRAQTGTGKSAAFLITILTRFKRNPIKEKRQPGTPRALIMVPTRELALQVEKDANALGKYSRCKVAAVFGGMDYKKQQQMLTEKVVDIVAATPGRLLDFKKRGDVHLDKVEILVIDEADRMLDMGFIPDMRQIISSTPPKTKRQTLFFGATLTPEVTRLSAQWTHKPFTVDIEPEQVAVDSVDQLVYLITSRERFKLLYNLITRQNLERVIVFCNRRDATKRLADKLKSYDINCAILSGDVDQKKRISTLENFRSGKIRVLVATDVAGRGIHVDDISHVVNYNLPMDPEDYVHRIGRTGRAGATGISISFATEDEAFQLPAIEEFLGEKLNCTYPEDALLAKLPSPSSEKTGSAKSRPRNPQPRKRSYPKKSGESKS